MAIDRPAIPTPATDEYGGYLVPPEFEAALLAALRAARWEHETQQPHDWHTEGF